MSVDFSNAIVGPSFDQAEFHARFEDATYFFDVYDNNPGLNLHVWTGSLQSGFGTTATGGTLRIVRTESALSGYLNDSLIYSTSWSSSRLVSPSLVLQLQPRSNDVISIRYDNFHLRGGCVGLQGIASAGDSAMDGASD